jgi:hypothetical protein
MPNELDKRFQEELGRYDSPVDKDALWQAVRPHKPKRRLIWLWLLPLALCVSIAGVWWRLSHAAKADSVEIVQEHADTGTTTGSSGRVVKKVPPGDLHTTKASADTPGLSNEMAGDNIQHPAIMPQRQAEKLSQKTEGLSRGVVAPVRPVAVAAVESASEEAQRHPDLALVETLPEAAAASAIDEHAMQMMPPLDLLPLSLNVDTDVNMPLIPAGPDLVLANRNKHRPWSLTLSGGYHAASRNLSDTLGGSWADLRSQSEQVLEAISADALLGYHTAGGLYLRAGFGYSVQHTRFVWESTLQQTDSITGITRIELAPNGDTLTMVQGQIARYQTTHWRKRTYNSLSFVEIPLLAGYTFRRGAFHLDCEGGVRLAISSSRRGDLLDDNAGLTTWPSVGGYKSSLLWRLQAGSSISYAIAPRWQIGLGAQVVLDPSSLTQRSAAFRESYHWYGLRAVVTHRL